MNEAGEKRGMDSHAAPHAQMAAPKPSSKAMVGTAGLVVGIIAVGAGLLGFLGAFGGGAGAESS